MDPFVISGVTAVVTALVGTVGYLFKEMIRLQGADNACRERLAQMNAEVWSLNARLEQLSWYGTDEPNALVVMDGQTGLIVEWSPGATIMMHWTAREMLGKPVTRVIPERFRQPHTEAIERLRTSGSPPRRGPFAFVALTKEGSEVPCEVSLSGWSTGNQRFIAATMRPRAADVESARKAAAEEKK